MFLDCSDNCTVWSLVNHFQQNRSCFTLLKRICVNKHRNGMKEERKYEHRGKFLGLINLKKTRDLTKTHFSLALYRNILRNECFYKYVQYAQTDTYKYPRALLL